MLGARDTNHNGVDSLNQTEKTVKFTAVPLWGGRFALDTMLSKQKLSVGLQHSLLLTTFTNKVGGSVWPSLLSGSLRRSIKSTELDVCGLWGVWVGLGE